MSVYAIEVNIHATAYVVASNESQALALVKQGAERSHIELPEKNAPMIGEFQVSGLPIDSERLPKLSISPAMTFGDVDPSNIGPELMD